MSMPEIRVIIHSAPTIFKADATVIAHIGVDARAGAVVDRHLGREPLPDLAG